MHKSTDMLFIQNINGILVTAYLFLEFFKYLEQATTKRQKSVHAFSKQYKLIQQIFDK